MPGVLARKTREASLLILGAVLGKAVTREDDLPSVQALRPGGNGVRRLDDGLHLEKAHGSALVNPI